ncbi:MAG: NUDIX domain-containing protein [Ignavibacteria bacterium]|nr:NUDIX domain-containing protein [Ignavibacteria bacterium]
MMKIKHKFLVYLIRGDLVLVSYHIDHPAAGLQVPGGSVEPNESPIDAAVRELEEESGHTYSLQDAFVHEYGYYPSWDDAVHYRTSFILNLGSPSPHSDPTLQNFSHIVDSGTLDKGIRLSYSWMPITTALELLNAGHDISLKHFQDHL